MIEDSNIAVLEPTAQKQLPPKHSPMWKVLLHNDDVNEAFYVSNTIQAIVKINEEDALQKMVEAHKTGVALLVVVHQELAELYQEQFQSKNLTTTIEPDN